MFYDCSYVCKRLLVHFFLTCKTKLKQHGCIYSTYSQSKKKKEKESVLGGWRGAVDAFRWPLLQNYEIWKSKPEQTSFPLEVMWSKWNKQQILGWKWCSQEPQAHITSPFKHFLFPPPFSFWSCRLEVSDIFWPSIFARWSSSFSSPARGAALSSQDAIDEDGHDGGTDQARDGHGYKPRHEDVPEQTPVHCLSRAQPSYCDHRANLQAGQMSHESE